jgi:5-(aminomethyl)-3-furanmethanol phosphate kinase
MCTIVYKLGGSLLELPELRERLCALLKRPLPFFSVQDPWKNRPLVVVGGGAIADSIRRWDEVHRLGDEVAHRLAMQSMSDNAHLVAALLADAQLVKSRPEADEVWSRRRVAVLAAAEFVDVEEQNAGDVLRRSWDVTSDSVAAYVAQRWPADALVLIKSVSLPAGCDANAASHRSLVDAQFPLLSRRVPVIGWVNLRSDAPTIERWL